MNKVIGIISYLPDDEKKRKIREEKITSLIRTCNDLFDLPIIIVAQNWKDFRVDCCQLYSFTEPLGIIGARKELRKVFLASNYDYLIMLDDDCVIDGDQSSAKKYLDQIDNHPGCFGMFKATLLKLFAISKEIFREVDYGDGKVEEGDFFEDILFVETLKKKYPHKAFVFNRGNLKETSNNYNDENSTWFHGQFNKRAMGDKTKEMVRCIN